MNEGVPIYVLITVIILVVVVALIQAYMNGLAMQKLMRSKGYTDNWFWQGFMFGPFAFMGAADKEDRGKAEYPDYVKEAIQKATDEHNLATGGWKCSACGRVNPANTGTCVCGANRHDSGKKVISEASK